MTYPEVVGYLLGLFVYFYWFRDKLFHTRYKDFSNVRESRSARAKLLGDSLPTPRERILEPLPNVPVFASKTEIKASPNISGSSTSKSSTGKQKEKRKKQKSGTSPKPTVDELEMGLEGRMPAPLASEEKDVMTARELSTTVDGNKPTEKKSTANIPEAGVTTAELIVDSKEAEENLKATKSPPCATETPASTVPGSVASKSSGSFFDPTQPTVTPAAAPVTPATTSSVTTDEKSKNTTATGSAEPTSGGAAKKKSKKKKGKKKKDKKKKKSSDAGMKSVTGAPSVEARVEVISPSDEKKKKSKEGAPASGHTPEKKKSRK